MRGRMIIMYEENKESHAGGHGPVYHTKVLGKQPHGSIIIVPIPNRRETQ